MATSSTKIVFGFAAILLTLFSTFFLFYTARLFYVTNGLRTIRAGGQGAYLGALVFPLLACLFGWGAWRCVRVIRQNTTLNGTNHETSELN